jgi:hypothetical protein
MVLIVKLPAGEVEVRHDAAQVGRRPHDGGRSLVGGGIEGAEHFDHHAQLQFGRVAQVELGGVDVEADAVDDDAAEAVDRADRGGRDDHAGAAGADAAGRDAGAAGADGGDTAAAATAPGQQDAEGRGREYFAALHCGSRSPCQT